MLPHYALQSASASLSLSLSNQINMLYWHEWKYDINIGKKRGTEQQKVEMNRKISQCFKVWTASWYVFLETRAAVRPLVAGVIMTGTKEEVRWCHIKSDDGWIKRTQTFTDETAVRFLCDLTR